MRSTVHMGHFQNHGPLLFMNSLFYGTYYLGVPERDPNFGNCPENHNKAKLFHHPTLPETAYRRNSTANWQRESAYGAWFQTCARSQDLVDLSVKVRTQIKLPSYRSIITVHHWVS